MEVYTQDIVDIACEYAEKIMENKSAYATEDNCVNLASHVKKLLGERLAVAFEDIIKRHKDEDFDMRKELFKTINEF